MTNGQGVASPIVGLRAGVGSMMNLDAGELSDGELASTIVQFRRELDRLDAVFADLAVRVIVVVSAVKMVTSRRPPGCAPGRGCAPVMSTGRSRPGSLVRSCLRRGRRGGTGGFLRVQCASCVAPGCRGSMMNSPPSKGSFWAQPSAKISGRWVGWRHISRSVRVVMVGSRRNVMVCMRRWWVVVWRWTPMSAG